MEFFYVVVILIILAVAQSQIYARLGFRGLTYDCAFSEQEASEGDEIKLVETVSNHKMLPLPWLRSELTTSMYLDFAGSQSLIADDARFVPSFFMMRGYRRTVRSWNVRCVKRGVYEVQKCILLVTDLLGLKTVSHVAEVKTAVTVLPRPLELQTAFTSANRLQGDIIVRRNYLDDPFYRVGVREYSPRDSMRNIHWAATARTGKMMVHNNQQTAEQNLLVILNLQSRSYETTNISDKDRIETAIRVCAGFFDDTLRSGLPVRFAANTSLDGSDGNIVTNEFSGQEHVLDLMRTLARLPMRFNESFTAFLKGTCERLTASDIVIVTAYLNDALYEYARARKEEGRHVKIVCVTHLELGEVPEDLEVFTITEEEAEQ